jgi:hypothetical protein
MQSVDAIGTRMVQGLMQIEVKTRRGFPSPSQMDTLSKLNLFCGEKVVDNCYVRFFGVFVLSMSGLCPDTSEHMWWGVIPKGRHIDNATKMSSKKIDKTKLIKLLRFDIHPRTFEANTFRRHHKTQTIIQVEKAPLGFEYERAITKRS